MKVVIIYTLFGMFSIVFGKLRPVKGEVPEDRIYAEFIVGGKPQGFGIYEMDMGAKMASIYLGNFEEGKLNGLGVRIGLDEDLFYGSFSNGQYVTGTYMDTHIGKLFSGKWDDDEQFAESSVKEGFKVAKNAMLVSRKKLQEHLFNGSLPKEYEYLINIIEERYLMLELMEKYKGYAGIISALKKPIKEKIVSSGNSVLLEELKKELSALRSKDNVKTQIQEVELIKEITKEVESKDLQDKYRNLELSYEKRSYLMWGCVIALALIATIAAVVMKFCPFVLRPGLGAIARKAHKLRCLVTSTRKKNKQLNKRNKKLEDLNLEAEIATANQAKAEADQLLQHEKLLLVKTEQDNILNAFSVQKHLEFFQRKADEVEENQIHSDLHTAFLTVYEKVKAVFKRTGQQDLDALESVSVDVKRINQIETVIKHYGQKITSIKEDEKLDGELRETQMAYWQRLMDTEVGKLEEV